MKGCKLQKLKLPLQLSSKTLCFWLSPPSAACMEMQPDPFSLQNWEASEWKCSHFSVAQIYTHLLAVSYELPEALVDLLVFHHVKAPFCTRLKLISHFDGIVPFKPWPMRLYILLNSLVGNLYMLSSPAFLHRVFTPFEISILILIAFVC